MNKRIRWTLYASIVVLFVLHNDFWFWYDPRIVFGLPVGLTYHVGYNVAAAVLMFLLVRFAWPSHLEVAGEMPEGDAQMVEGDEVARGRGAGSDAAGGGIAGDGVAGGDR